MSNSQPISVMSTRQLATHTLWVSTMARPAAKSTKPHRPTNKALSTSSRPIARYARPLAKRLTPKISKIGPSSLARKIDVCTLCARYLLAVRYPKKVRKPPTTITIAETVSSAAGFE
jgi:hypothetical protein